MFFPYLSHLLVFFFWSFFKYSEFRCSYPVLYQLFFLLAVLTLCSIVFSSSSYLFVLICMEISVVLCSILLLIISVKYNILYFTFFLLLLAAGETAILLISVLSNSEAYRFNQQTNMFNSFIWVFYVILLRRSLFERSLRLSI